MSAKTFQIRGPITTATQSVYIERPQDREVITYLQGANYITVLGARQTGKTSLLYHLIGHLPSEAYIPVLIDLSPIRDADKAQLYHFVSSRIAAQLALDEPLTPGLGSIPSQIEFQDFLKRAAQKAGTSSRILVMLDEFEAVPADLREGFFGTIRTVYNERGIQQEFERYLFLLAGATDPNSLISPESGLSPFNISQKVYLEDFDLEGVQEMVQYLGIPNPSTEKSLAATLFAQTHGHPNLSSKLCVFIKDRPGTSVEAAVEDFSSSGDENIHRVLEGLKNHQEETQWVVKLIQGEQTPKFDRSSALVARLELLGVIRRGGDGNCAIRNQIYENVLRNQLQLEQLEVTAASEEASRVEAEALEQAEARQIS